MSRRSNMSRSSKTQSWLLLLAALAAVALSVLPARPGLAATYTYDARQRVVNAGVLYIGAGSDTNPSYRVSNPAPYIFHVLNSRPDVKPVGWTFVNPLAPTQVTPAMVTRWGGAPAGYTVGQPLSPTMAAYWEVPLRDTSADQLQQFDVLYLHASYKVGTVSYAAQFTPADNEKLRRFVDGGGQLFVEYGAANAHPNPPTQLDFLFADVQWNTGSLSNSGLPFVGSLSFLHPIASQPYLLGATDFANLGMGSDTGIYGFLSSGGSGDYNALFGTVLDRYNGPPANTDTGSPAVVAGQLGAGQIVASALEIGRQSSLSFGANFGNPNPANAPTADLKLLSNAISWIDTHPTENKTSHQNAAGPSAASFAPAWVYKPSSNGSTTPPAAAVWGNFIFATDSVGTLHCFDAYPSEYLLGTASPDDGVADFISAPPAQTPYDQVWNASVGKGASAPTVFSYLNGTAYVTAVMVEKADGSILVFNALSKTANVAPVSTLTPPPSITTGGATAFSGVNAPAPTYYDGRIYAGQPNGDLYVYSLVGGGSASAGVRVPLTTSPSPTEYVSASPAVGLLPSSETTNTVVAYVATNQNMYTVLLGARNDPLVPYNTNGAQVGYNLNRNPEYFLPNIVVDTASFPTASMFDATGNIATPAPNPGGQNPVFSNTNSGTYFTNWDVDFINSLLPVTGNPNSKTLTLHEIKATSIKDTNSTGTLSAPAMDRQGDYYYTVNDGPNSYLIGVHPDLLQRSVRLKFRFRIPIANDPSAIDPTSTTPVPWNNVDADGVDYSDSTVTAHKKQYSLLDFKFVGAPVADGQGNVYVVAQPISNDRAAVLCFNANQDITAGDRPVSPFPANFDASAVAYTQNDENAPTQQNRLSPGGRTGNANTVAARYGQVIGSGIGPTNSNANYAHISVFDFGQNAPGGNRQIAGNLTEPQPFTAGPDAKLGTSAMWVYFHTNLAWYTTFPVKGAVSGLSLAGNTLMLTDSGSGYNTLYKLPATPAAIGVGKLVVVVPPLPPPPPLIPLPAPPTTLVSSPLGTDVGGAPISIGAVTAAPSAGGGVMVVNGSGGLAAFNQQLTLIADNNRILQVDNDGNAVWSADATTRLQANGASTKIDFAHPTSLYPVAANDYLVADTGNNRCVRFDHGGGVLWELTRFNDPSGLMAPGQPLTLSQPASVELRKEPFSYTDKNTSAAGTGTMYHYLVADSGNERIVEVTDTVDANGFVLWEDNTVSPPTFSSSSFSNAVYQDHVLTWTSHTGDKYGRHYRYAAATYLTIPKTQTTAYTSIEVFALVTNTRIAPLTPSTTTPTTYAFAPASSDAPGGSIVAFAYPSLAAFMNPLLPQKQLPFSQLAATNDLFYVANRFVAGTGSNAQTYAVHSPRFLHVYAPPQGMPASPKTFIYTFLYADDNGAFDLSYTGPNLTDNNPPMTSYGGFNGLAFARNDYQGMTVPIAGIPDIPGPTGPTVPYTSVNYNRGSIPFVPTCIQRLNDDNTYTPRYLITQSSGQSELGTPPIVNGVPAPVNRIGGEIFEVDVDSMGASKSVGGFSGGLTPPPPATNGILSGFTLSRPGGAGPLTQPTFAIRTPQ